MLESCVCLADRNPLRTRENMKMKQVTADVEEVLGLGEPVEEVPCNPRNVPYWPDESYSCRNCCNFTHKAICQMLYQMKACPRHKFHRHRNTTLLVSDTQRFKTAKGMRDTEDIKEMEVHSQGMTMSRDDWHWVTGFRCCHLEPVLDFMTFFMISSLMGM